MFLSSYYLKYSLVKTGPICVKLWRGLQNVVPLVETEHFQAEKLNFFGTHPNWAVSYIAYTKFHLPRPVFHSPGQSFTRIGERASASFPASILLNTSSDFFQTEWKKNQLRFATCKLHHKCKKLVPRISMPDVKNITALWPSDAIWRHRTQPKLAQVMACLTATSHYLNQCRLIISGPVKVAWGHIFTRYSSVINH